MTIVKNDLYDYKNRYIYQDSKSFRFSVDSILLAEYVQKPKSGDIIVDMCAGNMACPLILSTYYPNKMTGFEIQKDIASLALMSINENKLNGTLNVINDDVNNIGNYFEKESIDILICNPPYFKVGDKKVINLSENLRLARHEIAITLENIFVIAQKYLKNNGKFYMVHRADRIDEIIVLANKYHVNVKNMTFVTTTKTKNPYLVLIKCVKNAHFGVKIGSEICIENASTYQNIFRSN